MAETGLRSNRVPPQDIAAERGVLGGVLVHGADVLAGVAASLKPADFYDRRHAKIFAAMLALYEKDQPVDEITVTSRLSDEGQLEAVGAAAYLAELADILLGPAHVDHYASLVKDKALLRNFVAAAHQAIEEAHSHQADPDIALEGAERAIFAATQERLNQQLSPLSEVVTSALKVIETRFKNKGQVAGVPTGFKKLDQLTTGLQPGDLIIVAGRPSMGKTAFALNIATNAALTAGVTVGIFSLEMSKEQLGLRLLSAEARVSGSKIRSGFLSHAHDFPALTQAAERLHGAPVYIDDTPALSVLDLRSKARRLKLEFGLGLILVDYLQLMRGRGGADNREQEISNISRSLKALAKELNLPVVALSQLNRKVEERPGGDKRPMLSDLRESGAIEQDADVIAFIYRKKVYKKRDDPEEPDDNVAEIIIGKQRNGPTGTVRLSFVDDLTSFEEMASDFYEPGE
ncbi:MAG: replicative DNA helicase [Desulfarculus sp.]|nr:MAG: replicative DNA helicase [Desulfarculus sp.]